MHKPDSDENPARTEVVVVSSLNELQELMAKQRGRGAQEPEGSGQ